MARPKKKELEQEKQETLAEVGKQSEVQEEVKTMEEAFVDPTDEMESKPMQSISSPVKEASDEIMKGFHDEDDDTPEFLKTAFSQDVVKADPNSTIQRNGQVVAMFTGPLQTVDHEPPDIHYGNEKGEMCIAKPLKVRLLMQNNKYKVGWFYIFKADKKSVKIFDCKIFLFKKNGKVISTIYDDPAAAAKEAKKLGIESEITSGIDSRRFFVLKQKHYSAEYQNAINMAIELKNREAQETRQMLISEGMRL